VKLLLEIISVTKDDFEGLRKTIQSTKALRCCPGVKQIIIDSSSYGISKMIEKLVRSGNNIEYYRQKPTGIAAAFNLGLSLADSEWIWFLNGGDCMHSDTEPDKIIYLLKNSRADAIIFQNEVRGMKKVPKHPPMWAMWPPLNAWIPHPATFSRRNLYEQFSNFDESYDISMDFEFWLRCFSKQVTVDTVSIPLTIYDRFGISSTQHGKTAHEAVRAIKKHLWAIIRLWINNGKLIFKAWRFYIKIKKKCG
jgi:hypothetical protein